MKENNFILIPAFNEGNYKRNHFEHLRFTIKLIREAKFNGRIVVVNDGSTDNTEQIAKSEGVEVINLKKRSGKAKAVFFGLAQILKSNPTSVVTMDADLAPPRFSNYYKEDIEKLVNAANGATREGKIIHGRALVYEIKYPWAVDEKSGIRCFSRRAVSAIVRTRKGFVEEFELEPFLNELFKHHTVRIQTGLSFNIPLRTVIARKFQGKKRPKFHPTLVKPIPHKKR
jgi:glycosyltransferase involved in cell wall biosynthesis